MVYMKVGTVKNPAPYCYEREYRGVHQKYMKKSSIRVKIN